ncbi:Putative diheme cytochrome c-553 [Labilithrix luteola]|uniref:Putative diheme cytochrome c-553 n=1 Tax=Labilithrix luteola TaxID=1391654 RepID=A0A0K1PM21_9BACT|nr:cytochrome c [Labilithrix luteola]AKU94154.1 Putative diheme cytochrome c-553 [Labilithrix luteola]
MLKKTLKGAGIVLGAVVAVCAALALYVQVDGIPRYAHETPVGPKVQPTPARVERGKALAAILCTDCHLNADTGTLTGRKMSDLPPDFGSVVSKNITRDEEKGIGHWSDDELRYLLRTGVRPDGQYVPPYMIKLAHLSDEDLDSILAWLHSDDPLVAPTKVDPPGVTQPSFLVKALTHAAFKPLPFPQKPMVAPPVSDRVAYGRYMVTALDCFGCHSADFKSMNVLEPEKSEGYLGGGNLLKDVNGSDIRSANITFDEETGIGRWTEAQFVRAVREGFRPDGRVLHAPMMPMPQLREEEVAAIYAYLRTVPKIVKAVPRPTAPTPNADPAGKQLYAKYGCVACHGDSGAGAVGDLRKANERFPTDAELRAWLDDAPTMKPGTRMPGWKGIIRDEDYGPLMAHVRDLSRAGGTGASAIR